MTKKRNRIYCRNKSSSYGEVDRTCAYHAFDRAKTHIVKISSSF